MLECYVLDLIEMIRMCSGVLAVMFCEAADCWLERHRQSGSPPWIYTRCWHRANDTIQAALPQHYGFATECSPLCTSKVLSRVTSPTFSAQVAWAKHLFHAKIAMKWYRMAWSWVPHLTCISNPCYEKFSWATIGKSVMKTGCHCEEVRIDVCERSKVSRLNISIAAKVSCDQSNAMK